jgi:hypothetical protein
MNAPVAFRKLNLSGAQPSAIQFININFGPFTRTGLQPMPRKNSNLLHSLEFAQDPARPIGYARYTMDLR